MTKTWTSIKDYIADPIIDVVERDCVYPDCLIQVDGRRACEHACPFEQVKAQDDIK